MPRPSPLRRPTDRARARLRLVVLALAGLTVLLALPVGSVARQLELNRSAAAAATLTPVPAELLTAPPRPPADPSAVASLATTPVRWTAPDGATRTGTLMLGPDLSAGDTVTLWVDRHGDVGEPPGGPAVARNVGIFVGIVWTVLMWTLLLTLAITVRARLAAADDDEWTREWARVEPLWSGRIP